MTSPPKLRSPGTETAPLGPRGIVGKLIARPGRDGSLPTTVLPFAKALSTTFSHFAENTKQLLLGRRPHPVLEAASAGVSCISYPEQRRSYPVRFRGLHRLTQRSDGTARCVACECCKVACPARCIYIEVGEYDPGDPRSHKERWAQQFVIDELRCIFCGLCVEACPHDALRMDTAMHGAPYDAREEFIFDKELLLRFPGRYGEHGVSRVRNVAGKTDDTDNS